MEYCEEPSLRLLHFFYKPFVGDDIDFKTTILGAVATGIVFFQRFVGRHGISCE